MKNSSYISTIRELEQKGLAPTARTHIETWLTEPGYAEYRTELEALIDSQDVAALNDAFYQIIPFGTGGRRGKMGIGPNRINARTISESAQGFVTYVIETFGLDVVRERGLVITYDVRHNSALFADIVAGIFAAHGARVFVYTGVRSTPQLSFSIRHLNAIAGVMISASHNPPSDNGIKVYWQHGGQVVPPHDARIIDVVSRVEDIRTMDLAEAKQQGLIVDIGKEVDDAYASAVGALSLSPHRDISIIFTPMHGCASTSFLPVLRHVGFTHIQEVTEHMPLDPDFSSLPNHVPNPEVRESLTLALTYAKESHADVVVASDPDADRIGVISKSSIESDDYIFLNGNSIAVLLFDYITTQWQLTRPNDLPKSVLMKTVVTSELLTLMAKKYGVRVQGNLPVGFKYIADAMEHMPLDEHFLFGAEESHGYLYGTYARDKDGAVAALLICEYAAYLKAQGLTLAQQLENIKKEYGYYKEIQQSLYFAGMDGMQRMRRIMDVLRSDVPKTLGGLSVMSFFDQQGSGIIDAETGTVIEPYTGFKDNAVVLYLNTERSIRVVVRPSGTEPKIKFYVAFGQAVGMGVSDDEYRAIQKQVEEKTHALLADVITLAERISPGGKASSILG